MTNDETKGSAEVLVSFFISFQRREKGRKKEKGKERKKIKKWEEGEE